ncbi:MAG: class I SAM-dependent methyltransferase [Candidatus Acidiferrales bacterium]
MSENAPRVAQSMRRDWDDRARKDAYFYIASWKQEWDEESFLKSGEQDYIRLVESTIKRLGFVTSGKSMLELGCGAGRMTRSFAQRFERVIAFDVSPEMIERGRRIHAGLSGVTWLLGDGTNLATVPSSSVDFVFSYLVLQHLPAQHLVETYVAEMMRVLADGGLCLFQFNGGSNRHDMNWKGRMVWRIIDFLWTMRLESASRRMAALMGLDPEMGGKNWHGVPVQTGQICAMVRKGGGSVLETSGEDTPMAWCCATKPAATAEKLKT